MALAGATAHAAETGSEERLRLLERRNQLLESQLQKQQEMIESLTREVGNIRRSQDQSGDSPAADASSTGIRLGNLHLSGEAGIAFFNTGSAGFAPHSEFRVDEARIYLEAPIWNEVYFFGELNLATREDSDLSAKLGEFYLDFENISQLWGRDTQLNLRIGRLEIPFGEEYLHRDAIDNPLISHSLADFWGIDPGVELYGALGKFSYVLAVQNGSAENGVQDFDGDKSIVARVGWDPVSWLHFSISGMRTGNVDVENDRLSAIWFGNGFFRSIGGPDTTRFHANVVEGDATVRWRKGHLSAFGGYVAYDDNDPAADNSRDIFFYSVEAVQQVYGKLYAAARFSDIIADDGYALAGHGDFGTYFFDRLSTRLWRLSLGLGYRFSDRLVTKIEYTIDRGEELGGAVRNNEDLFATEAVFKF
ncbi:MAG TPA: hypothetical protein VEH04_00980 [Verrucomicrobiae bacterium]|nr:hypothetical protein [Verrucomicrobiae bacterium]